MGIIKIKDCLGDLPIGGIGGGEWGSDLNGDLMNTIYKREGNDKFRRILLTVKQKDIPEKGKKKFLRNILNIEYKKLCK